MKFITYLSYLSSIIQESADDYRIKYFKLLDIYNELNCSFINYKNISFFIILLLIVSLIFNVIFLFIILN